MFDWSPEPKADCVKCRGAGFLYAPVQRDDYGRVRVEVSSFGRAVPCKAPGCYDDQWNRRHAIRLQFEREYGKPWTFEAFDEGRPGSERCCAAAKELGEGMASYNWLILYGGTGNGKSHLLRAIAAALAERGIGAWYSTVSDLLTEYWTAVKSDQGPEFLERVKHHKFLILDDWKPEQGTDAQRDRLEEVLDYRYAHNLPVVMATNRDILELPERLQSRFRDKERSRAVLNKSTDYRIEGR